MANERKTSDSTLRLTHSADVIIRGRRPPALESALFRRQVGLFRDAYSCLPYAYSYYFTYRRFDNPGECCLYHLPLRVVASTNIRTPPELQRATGKC